MADTEFEDTADVQFEDTADVQWTATEEVPGMSGTITEIINSYQNGITLRGAWEGLKITDRATTTWNNPNFKDVTLQVRGTFGGGASIRMEGSNDIGSETWARMADITGSEIILTAAGAVRIHDTPYKMRIRLVAGNAGTDIDGTLTASTMAER